MADLMIFLLMSLFTTEFVMCRRNFMLLNFLQYIVWMGHVSEPCRGVCLSSGEAVASPSEERGGVEEGAGRPSQQSNLGLWTREVARPTSGGVPLAALWKSVTSSQLRPRKGGKKLN